MKTEKIHLLSLCSVFAIVAHHLEVKNLLYILVSLKSQNCIYSHRTLFGF